MSGLSNRWGLTRVRRFYIPASNGKTVVPQSDATDIIINDSPLDPADDYRAFPEIDLDPNGNDIWLIYSQTIDHSSGATVPGSHVLIRKSTDFGATWPIINNDEVLIGGQAITVTQSGRVVTQHTDFGNTLGNGVRRPYHRYSDTDASASSFTSLTHSQTYYPNPGQVMGGPGKAIKVSDYLLKAVYHRPAATGNRGIGIWKSVDDGETWSWISNVIVAGTDFDYEEPCLAHHPNGLLICSIKSETLDYSVYSMCFNGGYDWSMPLFTMNSEGKNPIAFSSNGTAVIIGRKFPSSDWRVIYSYWDGLEWSAEQYLDSRTDQYMYGGVIWHPGISKFIAVYSLDTNFPNGPAYLVVKYLNEV